MTPKTSRKELSLFMQSEHDQEDTVKRRLFNIEEVSVYTGLSVHTLYTMVSQRRIPFVKAGRLTKFDLKAIDAWIEQHSFLPVGTQRHRK